MICPKTALDQAISASFLNDIMTGEDRFEIEAAKQFQYHHTEKKEKSAKHMFRRTSPVR
jgi:hypothetical protein